MDCPPIIGFHHVYANETGVGARIADQQHDRLHRSGLLSITDEIRVGVLGRVYHPKSGICKVWYDQDPTKWELFTLDLMHTHAKSTTGEYLYWYIHTKGASYGVNVPWRDKMEVQVIDQHRECISDLIHYQPDPDYYAPVGYTICCGKIPDRLGSVGPFLSYNPHPFYAGNFFWTTASHVRRLLNPYDLLAERKSRGLAPELDRFIAEEWITQGIPGRTVEEELLDIKPLSYWNGEQPK